MQERLLRRLLTVDSAAGLAAGAAMLGFAGTLAGWYAVPPSLVVTVGVVNLTYGSASGLLAVAAHRGLGPTRRNVRVLATANLSWAAVCGLLALAYSGSASALGLAAMLGEALFVGSLGVLEARAGGWWAR